MIKLWSEQKFVAVNEQRRLQRCQWPQIFRNNLCSSSSQNSLQLRPCAILFRSLFAHSDVKKKHFFLLVLVEHFQFHLSPPKKRQCYCFYTAKSAHSETHQFKLQSNKLKPIIGKRNVCIIQLPLSYFAVFLQQILHSIFIYRRSTKMQKKKNKSIKYFAYEFIKNKDGKLEILDFCKQKFKFTDINECILMCIET